MIKLSYIVVRSSQLIIILNKFQHESKVLRDCKDLVGIPYIHWAGTLGSSDLIITELVGTNLE